MENLPKKGQLANVFKLLFLELSKLKLFLFLVLGLVVLVLVIKTKIIPFPGVKEKGESVETTTPTGSSLVPSGPVVAVNPNMVEFPEGLVLALPVGRENLDKAILDEGYSQVLSFFLPNQTLIRAVFGGRVTQVLYNQKPFPGDLAFNEIRLERNDGEFWVSYVFVGEILVQEDQGVVEGEVLAKAGEGGLGFRSGANLSIWLHNKNDEMVKLTKEIFN